jgi:hypothetical protein
VSTLAWILDRRLGHKDCKPSVMVIWFLAQYAAHPLDHLTPRSTGSDDHGEVRFG